MEGSTACSRVSDCTCCGSNLPEYASWLSGVWLFMYEGLASEKLVGGASKNFSGLFVLWRTHPFHLDQGSHNLWDLMPDYLRWSWCNNNGNKVHIKCNAFESSPNHPPPPRSMEKPSSMKPVPGPRKVGDHCPRRWSELAGKSFCHFHNPQIKITNMYRELGFPKRHYRIVYISGSPQQS